MIFRINLNDLILNASGMKLYIRQNFNLYEGSSSADEPHFLQLESSDITRLMVGSEEYKWILINLKNLIKHLGPQNVNLVNHNQIPNATWLQIMRYFNIIPRSKPSLVEPSSRAVSYRSSGGTAVTALPADDGLPLLTAADVSAVLEGSASSKLNSPTTVNTMFAYKKARETDRCAEVEKLKSLCNFLNEQANALRSGESAEQVAKNLTNKASVLATQMNMIQQQVNDSVPPVMKKKKGAGAEAVGHSSTSVAHPFG